MTRHPLLSHDKRLFCFACYCGKILTEIRNIAANHIVLIFAICLVALSGCKPDPSIPQESKKQVATKALTVKAAPTGSVVDQDTFQLIYPNPKLKDNQQTIRVIAKQGYKVNENFPARLVVKSSEKIELSQSKIDGERIKKDELVYLVKMKAPSGKYKLSGTAEFSICNDMMCKLYKEDLTWTLEAL